MDRQGNITACKEISDVSDFRVASFKYFNDSSIYISAGISTLVKVDTGLNILWVKRYGIENGGVSRMEISKEGDIVFGGGMVDGRGYAIRTDKDGNIKWCKIFNADTLPLYLTGFFFLDDGGIVLSGKGNGIYFARLDSTGNVIWAKSFDNTPFAAFPVSLTRIGNLLFTCGFYNDIPFVLSITADGNFRFMKLFKSNQWQECFSSSIISTYDNYLVFNTNPFGYFNDFAWSGLIKIDTNANILNVNNFLVDKPMYSESITETKDRGLAIICTAPDSITYFNTTVIITDDSFNHICRQFKPIVWTVDTPMVSSVVPPIKDTIIQSLNISLTENTYPFSYAIICLNDTAEFEYTFPVNSVSETYFFTMKIFPNPFSTQLTLTLADNEQTTVSLYNFLGQQVLRQSFTNTTTINTGQLAAGIYFYQLASNKGTLKTGKLVKQ